MKVVCKSCKKQIDTEKHDFCPKCGANLSEAEAVLEKEEKDSKPLFFLNNDLDNTVKRELTSAGMQILFALAVVLVFWLFGWL